MRRSWPPLAAVALALALAPPAQADSGAITGLRTDGSSLRADYVATATTCARPGACGWFPYAVQVEGGSACATGTDRLTFVGDFARGLGTQRGSDAFTPAWPALRICLYVRRADGADALVAQATWPVAAGGPPSAPAPEAGTPSSLRASEARGAVDRVLRRRFGARFTGRRAYVRECRRLSAAQMRCRVRFTARGRRYAGTLVVRAREDGRREAIDVTGTVRRAQAAAATFPVTPTG
jgi:hypothetical protein